MHANQALLETFYAAFQRRDGAGMAACYAPDVHFEDPVFSLDGARAHAMWRLLCDAGRDLRVTASGLTADDLHGRAHWEARYTLPATRRPVHNVVEAEFRFVDGRISWHRDVFDLRRWSRQAFGPLDVVLGWTPALRWLVRRQAARDLDRYVARTTRPRPAP